MSLFEKFTKKKPVDLPTVESAVSSKETQNTTIHQTGSNKDSEGYYFQNLDEFMTYVKLFRKGQNHETIWLDGEAYIEAFNNAYQQFEKKEYWAALDTLKKCLELNPIGISARFEICEIYIQLKRYNNAKEALLCMKDMLNNVSDIARFYRRLGFISIEEGKLSLAAACYRYSLTFEEHPSVKDELQYIRSKCNSQLNDDPITALLAEGLPVLEGINETQDQNTSSKVSKQRVSFCISVSGAELEPYLNAIHQERSQTIRVPGFRQGRAPRKMIESLYGEDFYLEESIQICIADEIKKKLSELGLRAISVPKYTIKSASVLHGFVAEVECDECDCL